MDISSNSLLPVMTKQGKERDSLSLIKSIGSLVGGLIFSMLPALIIGLFPSQPHLGYYVLIIIAVVFVLILSIIGTLGVKERVQPIEKEKYHAREIFKILGAAPVFTYFIAMLILGLGTGSFFTSFAFFAQYVFNNPLLVATQALVGLVGQIIGLSVGRAIIGRLGRKNLQVLGMLIGFVPIIFILLIPPTLSMLIYVVFIFNGIGTGMYSVVGYGLQADNIDYVEWKQGHRTEGAVTSLTTFVQKAGMGIGSAIPAFIFGMTGYIPNAAVQPPDAILGIKWAYVIFPTICAVISIVFFWIFYPITKEKNSLIASELAARHK